MYSFIAFAFAVETVFARVYERESIRTSQWRKAACNLFYQENEPDLEAIAQSGDLDDPNVFVEAAKEGWVTVKAEGMGNWAWTYYYMDELDSEGFPIQYVSNAIHYGLPSDPPATPEKPHYLSTD